MCFFSHRPTRILGPGMVGVDAPILASEGKASPPRVPGPPTPRTLIRSGVPSPTARGNYPHVFPVATPRAAKDPRPCIERSSALGRADCLPRPGPPTPWPSTGTHRTRRGDRDARVRVGTSSLRPSRSYPTTRSGRRAPASRGRSSTPFSDRERPAPQRSERGGTSSRGPDR